MMSRAYLHRLLAVGSAAAALFTFGSMDASLANSLNTDAYYPAIAECALDGTSLLPSLSGQSAAGEASSCDTCHGWTYCDDGMCEFDTERGNCQGDLWGEIPSCFICWACMPGDT